MDTNTTDIFKLIINFIFFSLETMKIIDININRISTFPINIYRIYTFPINIYRISWKKWRLYDS